MKQHFYTYLFVLFALHFSVLQSCKTKSKEGGKDTSELSEDFMDFYAAFHTDSIFQMEHILFPLAGGSNSSIAWDKESWKIHRPFDDHSGSFTRNFYDLSGIILEKIQDKQGYFKMERRFSKLSDGKWHLIFYKLEEPHSDSTTE